MLKIDCEKAFEILNGEEKTIVIENKERGRTEGWTLDVDEMAGTVSWVNALDDAVYATPFWEGCEGIPFCLQSESGDLVNENVIHFPRCFKSKTEFRKIYYQTVEVRLGISNLHGAGGRKGEVQLLPLQ